MTTQYQKELSERDAHIIRLNAVGLSLATISEILGCHPSTITHRLKKLKVTPIDSRRAFMEDVIRALSDEEQAWLVDLLEEKQMNIKEFVIKLIKHKFHQIEEAKNVE